MKWWDDPEEVVAFARYFFLGSKPPPRLVINVFEKPWKWDTEYADYKEMTK